ncbi:enolase C-terminal domain-like protein [Bradyrhizobium vignae]|uniref:Putative Mandelate racemase/muconate lactonizing enzyme family protein n=1 Tax=Bradyrhizobium vignae TaxID=1549949 RepID=A0A2U3Q6S2_9BRAD|nr:enolase C-terminal domain-like protein [Bradyrhizobium vignae]SPP97131.1 putative Mandelate racemase/muconate lactonizing enzyme family protein [Bradyrhizobium vignae]
MRSEVPIRSVRAEAYRVPTDRPEADGTISWNSTTIVLVEVEGGGRVGLGYTYASACIVGLIRDKLAAVIAGQDALAPASCFGAMQRAVRNLGREGLAATAISAVDTALHDLKARLFDQPLVVLLGARRTSIPIYGSGGFTTYSDAELEQQLGGWVAKDGCAFVKMKIGSEPGRDPHRVAVAKRAIGDALLFVDANGACTPRQAIRLANIFAERDVRWFEEPVSSDDLPGLAMVRQHAPCGMDVAAGEYAYTVDYVRTMLASGAVDVQQADATRCGGFTGFLEIAALCNAFHVDLSAHCAPALHMAVACAAPRIRHLEWFHDHVRIEHMLFDGAPQPRDGRISPDLTVPGNGLIFKRADAAAYAVSEAA